MTKKISSLLVLLSGVIILIISGLNIAGFLLIYFFIKIGKKPPQYLINLLGNFIKSTTLTNIIFLLIITLFGIALIAASKKIKKNVKTLRWSILALVLGLIIFFEMGGKHFGIFTAGILSILGGAFGISEARKMSY